MLFHVKMTVNLPLDMEPTHAAQLKADEKALAQNLMREGKWRHLWRIAGHYANYSVFDVESVEALTNAMLSEDARFRRAEGRTGLAAFDVESVEALHDTLLQLPLFPYMDIEVAPICRHPSSVHADDR